MGKYNIGIVRKHFEKSLQTSHGGKVYSKRFKQLLDAKKNPFLSSKQSKLTTYDHDVLQKIARGKDTHTLTDQEVSRAIKALKKIGAGSEGVELTVSAKKYSAQEAYKGIQKEQLKAETPTGPTPAEIEHEKIVHERRMNVTRLYRQWAIDKEQGGVLGGRFQPGSNAKTSVLTREDPRGSVTPDPDKAQTSISDHRTAATSASSDKTDSGHASGAGETKPAATEKASQNRETQIPSIAGGAPDTASQAPDTSPVTEGPMRVVAPGDSGEFVGPLPDQPAADTVSDSSAETPASEEKDVDSDLPFGP